MPIDANQSDASPRTNPVAWLALALFCCATAVAGAPATEAPPPAEAQRPSDRGQAAPAAQDGAPPQRRSRSVARRAPSGRSEISADRAVTFPADI